MRDGAAPLTRDIPLSAKRDAGSGDARAALAAALIAVAQGDRAALERVYATTSAKLFGICLRILPDRNHAEEALQETYLSIWRRAGAFDPDRGTAMTWLMTLARNAAIDRLRALARAPHLPLPPMLDIIDPGEGPLDATLATEERQRLHACVGELEETDRRFIAAAFFEGLSYPELATRVDMPLPTVKSRIRRALLKLRGCLA